MKKARILLAMLLALSVFTFTGCGGNDANDNAGNDTTVEESVDQDAKDVKDDAEDMGEDIKDGAEDMMDGSDTKDNTEETNN